ncbi:VWA domain-containing protein [Actinosynnema sp. CS-041913]|uniref:VWA domain-containing protein n=1 Tax=Actinosynnema sp. CS-041913 TaxID=3239917 RepID=UPI003D8A5FD6
MIGRTSRATAVAVVGVLLGGLLLADRPSIANAQAEPLKPYRIGASRGGPGDLWSTDANGGDQQAVTRGGRPHESDPAYSPDGTRIAWTEYPGSEQPARVWVADADGSNARRLSGREGQSEPSWSPDGTRLAVTDGDSIGIVRVSDGVLLSSVPKPDHLRSQDSTPAWSPDGGTIAFSRNSQGLDTPLVTPRSVGGSTPLGGSFTTSATLRTPTFPRLPEIMFLLDTTGSMGTALASFKLQIPAVMDAITAKDPGARFGLASYKDTWDGPLRYELVENLATAARIREVLLDERKLQAFGGGSILSEDWFNGLHRLTRDLDPADPGRHRVFNTEGASRIIVIAGDATSKQAGDPCDPPPGTSPPSNPSECSPPYYSLDEVKEDLTGTYPPVSQPRGVKVVAVPILTRSDGLNTRGQARALVDHTGGTLVEAGAKPEAIAQAIDGGIRSLPVTVTPVAHCPQGVSITFQPPSVTVGGDTEVTFQETVRLDPPGPSASAVGDTRGCTVRFLFNGAEPTDRREQTIRITEAAAGLPTVVVNGAAAPSPQGVPVPVEFSATATSATGQPLTPSCDATSGASFPVGITTVTCTATSGGRTGRASSVVAVFVPENVPYRDLWLADVGGGPVVQTDLSIRFGRTCGRVDGHPDWSPDGNRLVFQHEDALCVANAAGGNATVLVPEGDGAEEPAWSPDGALIVFSRYTSGEGPRRIFGVPPSGGPQRELVSFGEQDARSPAFQRLPDLVVTGSGAPARIPFEGTTTARFVVTNTGHTPAAQPATVTLTVPPGLRVDSLTTTVGSCFPGGTTCSLGRLAPRSRAEIRVTLTGIAAGQQVVRAEVGPDVNPADNRAEVAVTVDEEIKPPVTPGSLALAVAVLPAESFVGGDDITVVYKMRNGAGTPMTGVRIVTSLPAQLLPPRAVSPGCAADGAGCDIGVLQPLQEAEVRITLPAKAAVDTSAGGSVLGVGPDNDAADNTSVAQVLVRQPRIAVEPLVGPTGFVPRVTGGGFPPGGTVRLTWTVGISAEPGTVPVRADGTIDAQVLVFENDLIGPRELAATPVAGPGFGAVRSNPFLVVPRTLQPPDFAARG